MTDDPDTMGFFVASARGELAVCTCRSCGESLHLPRSVCHRCGGRSIEWRAVRPQGKVYAWTVVEHQAHPAFPTPYTLVLISLDDAPGIRLVGHLPGRPAMCEGMPLWASFEHPEGAAGPLIRWSQEPPSPVA